MRPLTVFDAEAEARWRWGGFLARGFARYSSGMRKPFEVGAKRFGLIKIRGRGTSWKGAFRNADTLTNHESSEKPLGSGASSHIIGGRSRSLP